MAESRIPFNEAVNEFLAALELPMDSEAINNWLQNEYIKRCFDPTEGTSIGERSRRKQHLFEIILAACQYQSPEVVSVIFVKINAQNRRGYLEVCGDILTCAAQNKEHFAELLRRVLSALDSTFLDVIKQAKPDALNALKVLAQKGTRPGEIRLFLEEVFEQEALINEYLSPTIPLAVIMLLPINEAGWQRLLDGHLDQFLADLSVVHDTYQESAFHLLLQYQTADTVTSVIGRLTDEQLVDLLMPDGSNEDFLKLLYENIENNNRIYAPRIKYIITTRLHSYRRSLPEQDEGEEADPNVLKSNAILHHSVANFRGIHSNGVINDRQRFLALGSVQSNRLRSEGHYSTRIAQQSHLIQASLGEDQDEFDELMEAVSSAIEAQAFEEALEMVQETIDSLEQDESSGPENLIKKIRSKKVLANIHIAQDDYRNALQAYEDALMLSDVDGGSMNHLKVEILIQKSALLRTIGNITEAQECLQIAETLLTERGLPYAKICFVRALCHESLGQYRKAKDCYTEALSYFPIDLDKAELAAQDAEVAYQLALNYQGLFKIALKQVISRSDRAYDSAMQYFQEAVERYQVIDTLDASHELANLHLQNAMLHIRLYKNDITTLGQLEFLMLAYESVLVAYEGFSQLYQRQDDPNLCQTELVMANICYQLAESATLDDERTEFHRFASVLYQNLLKVNDEVIGARDDIPESDLIIHVKIQAAKADLTHKSEGVEAALSLLLDAVDKLPDRYPLLKISLLENAFYYLEVSSNLASINSSLLARFYSLRADLYKNEGVLVDAMRDYQSARSHSSASEFDQELTEVREKISQQKQLLDEDIFLQLSQAKRIFLQIKIKMMDDLFLHETYGSAFPSLDTENLVSELPVLISNLMDQVFARFRDEVGHFRERRGFNGNPDINVYFKFFATVDSLKNHLTEQRLYAQHHLVTTDDGETKEYLVLNKSEFSQLSSRHLLDELIQAGLIDAMQQEGQPVDPTKPILIVHNQAETDESKEGNDLVRDRLQLARDEFLNSESGKQKAKKLAKWMSNSIVRRSNFHEFFEPPSADEIVDALVEAGYLRPHPELEESYYLQCSDLDDLMIHLSDSSRDLKLRVYAKQIVDLLNMNIELSPLLVFGIQAFHSANFDRNQVLNVIRVLNNVSKHVGLVSQNTSSQLVQRHGLINVRNSKVVMNYKEFDSNREVEVDLLATLADGLDLIEQYSHQVAESRQIMLPRDQFTPEPIETTDIIVSEVSADDPQACITSIRQKERDKLVKFKGEVKAALDSHHLKEGGDGPERTLSGHHIPGLGYQRVPGDGHCLFHAVGLYLGEDAAFLRRIVAARMEHDFEEFQNYREGTPEDFRAYIEAIRNGKEWGDNIEIEIIQRVTGRPVIIFRPDGATTIPDNINDYEGEPIFVYYNGHTHYDALLVQGGFTARNILEEVKRSRGNGEGDELPSSLLEEARGIIATLLGAKSTIEITEGAEESKQEAPSGNTEVDATATPKHDWLAWHYARWLVEMGAIGDVWTLFPRDQFIQSSSNVDRNLRHQFNYARVEYYELCYLAFELSCQPNNLQLYRNLLLRVNLLVIKCRHLADHGLTHYHQNYNSSLAPCATQVDFPVDPTEDSFEQHLQGISPQTQQDQVETEPMRIMTMNDGSPPVGHLQTLKEKVRAAQSFSFFDKPQSSFTEKLRDISNCVKHIGLLMLSSDQLMQTFASHDDLAYLPYIYKNINRYYLWDFAQKIRQQLGESVSLNTKLISQRLAEHWNDYSTPDDQKFERVKAWMNNATDRTARNAKQWLVENILREENGGTVEMTAEEEGIAGDLLIVVKDLLLKEKGRDNCGSPINILSAINDSLNYLFEYLELCFPEPVSALTSIS